MNKHFFLPPMRIIGALGLGYIFIAYSGLAAAWIAQVIGVLFVIPSFVLLLTYLLRTVKHLPSVFPFMSLGSFVLGVWLLADPYLFVGVFNYFLGVVLIVAGLQQLMSAWLLRSATHFYGLYFLVPILLILGGIFSFSSNDRNLVTLIVGVFLFFYAINELLRWLLVDIRKQKRTVHESKNSDDDDYIEIISESVDDVDSSPVSGVKSDINN